MILGIRTRIIYDFLVIIQGSYMISLFSYKDRTKKSSMDSMKSYMILVWNQRNFNPGESLDSWCNKNKMVSDVEKSSLKCERISRMRTCKSSNSRYKIAVIFFLHFHGTQVLGFNHNCSQLLPINFVHSYQLLPINYSHVPFIAINSDSNAN